MTDKLFDRSRCLFAVIDEQAAFLKKLQARKRGPRGAWMMRVACTLAIPMVVTGKAMEDEAPPRPAIPPDSPVFDKQAFGMAGQPDIMMAPRATGRDHAVLPGLKTDVCAAQSALGLAL